MKFIYADGGRKKYFKGKANDCVCRAICNATGKDYKEIYDFINELCQREFAKKTKKQQNKSNARNGIAKDVTRIILEKYFKWKWHPLSRIGVGCTTHLNEKELPEGILILKLSKHLTCVKDKVLYDTYDCSRDGTRCVYGYWSKD